MISMNNFRRNIKFMLGLVVVVAVIFGIGLFWQPQAATGNLKIYFLNVGQGDASYIKTPSGEDILIDGGPDSSVLNELGSVMDVGDHEINLVILTHPHADHITGLLEVMQRYQIDEVWETGVEYPSSVYESWKKEITQKQIPDKIVKTGDAKQFGETKILVLYPLSPIAGEKIDNLNNASIVNRLDYKKFSALFLGDAEIEVQKKIAPSMKVATVLKVGHHGSRNGTTKEMLEVVRPALAVISSGKDNKFGHPHTEALNLLKQFAVRIFRTDQNGRVEIFSDGEGYNVSKQH